MISSIASLSAPAARMRRALRGASTAAAVLPARLRAGLLRALCPLLIERMGPGCLFLGRLRLPRPFCRVRMGARCMLGAGVLFQTGREGRIDLGDEVSLNTGAHVVACRSIRIGHRTAVGEYVSIRDHEHRFTPGAGVRGQGYDVAPVEIGEGCWIGRGVHVGPGTVIGPGCIVAANSVVRGRFEGGLLIAGAPARARRRILPDGRRVPLDAGEGA